MRIIYLLSGPETKKGFSEEIKKYLRKDLEGKNQITFIASSPDNYKKNDLYVNGDGENITGMKNHMKEVSNLKQISILDNRFDTEEGKKIISNSEVIYLLGGNPFTQLDYLKDNGYDEALKKFNGILLATSCGAMNLSKESYYSKDDDYDKSFFYKGINMIDITIDPHFNISNEEQIKEAKEFSKINKIVGLPNESAIRITKDKVTYINKCFIFDNGLIKERDDYEDK